MNFKYDLLKNQVVFANVLSSILENRGIENIADFLNPTERFVENTNLYDNSDKWVEGFIYSVTKLEKFGIVFDSDCDGYTSGSMLYQYAKRLNPNVDIKMYVHKGKAHGLEDVKDDIISDGIESVFIPDASSSDYEYHEELFKLGIRVYISDHHEADKGYSKHAVVVNNQLSKNVTDKALTGVGVTYKLLKEVDCTMGVSYADDYLELVTLGTIGDVADLKNLEARYYVMQGLRQINEKRFVNKFIKHTVEKRAFSLGDSVTITGVAFFICPLINAMCRFGDYEENLTLVKALCNIEERCVDKIKGKGEVEMSLQEYAFRVCEKVKRRQDSAKKKGSAILEEQIAEYNMDKMQVMILNGTNIIDKSLSGLVATEIAKKYHRPCIVVKENDKKNFYGGSGRGYDNHDIRDFRQWCKSTGLFSLCEGHDNAFGVGIAKYNINKLYSYISTLPLSSELTYHVDGVFEDNMINSSIVMNVGQFDYIWGNRIDEPIFALKISSIPTASIGLQGKTGNTLKFNYNGIDFIQFNIDKDKYKDLISNEYVRMEVICKFKVNRYAGNIRPQIEIVDYKFEQISGEINPFLFM